MIRLENRVIGKDSPVFITAELGTGHNGDLNRAHNLITAAKEAGADCVKFQWVIAREILHPLTGEVKLPGGSISLYRRFEELEQPFEFYAALKEVTEKAGLVFLCSPFGMESLEGLARLGVRGVKIASPELNHYPLLAQAVKLAPVILSTGVSTREDISKALEITGKDSLLLHCVTSYPAPEEDYNLKTLPFLAKTFGTLTGISDHSLDPLLVPVLAVSQGAVFIEKHFTLSNTDPGLDDPIALTPDKFRLLTEGIRKAERLSTGEILEWMSSEYSSERVKKVLGVPGKFLAESEKDNYATTNRSIHALYELSPGTTLTRENTAILRTEKNLTPGLSPEFWPEILGKKTKKRIPSGEGILYGSME